LQADPFFFLHLSDLVKGSHLLEAVSGSHRALQKVQIRPGRTTILWSASEKLIKKFSTIKEKN
jgi:hypothetical protein